MYQATLQKLLASRLSAFPSYHDHRILIVFVKENTAETLLSVFSSQSGLIFFGQFSLFIFYYFRI